MSKKIMLMLAFLVFLIVAGCQPIPPCGEFTFTGAVVDTAAQNGVDMDVSFDFDPGECEFDCACDLVCYVQIVRTVDLNDGTYHYPSTEKADRATADGWYLDRLAGRIWGYYGRYDDGTFAASLDTGSDVDPAILYDSPRRGEAEPWLGIWWQAVSVPVCIDEDSDCENQLLGYYFWSWWVDDDGNVPGIIDTIAWEPQDEDFDEAVDEWNAQAPGLGKNTFPAFTGF